MGTRVSDNAVSIPCAGGMRQRAQGPRALMSHAGYMILQFVDVIGCHLASGSCHAGVRVLFRSAVTVRSDHALSHPTLAAGAGVLCVSRGGPVPGGAVGRRHSAESGCLPRADAAACGQGAAAPGSLPV